MVPVLPGKVQGGCPEGGWTWDAVDGLLQPHLFLSEYTDKPKTGGSDAPLLKQEVHIEQVQAERETTTQRKHVSMRIVYYVPCRKGRPLEENSYTATAILQLLSRFLPPQWVNSNLGVHKAEKLRSLGVCRYGTSRKQELCHCKSEKRLAARRRVSWFAGVKAEPR